MCEGHPQAADTIQVDPKFSLNSHLHNTQIEHLFFSCPFRRTNVPDAAYPNYTVSGLLLFCCLSHSHMQKIR